MGENDVVRLMALDLQELCDVFVVDTGIYNGNKEGWYTEDYSKSAKNPIRWLEGEKVAGVVQDFDPDVVIVNSGGMSLRPDTFASLSRRGITTIGISLSDPDVYYDNGRVYARMFDLFYTNSKYAQDHLYKDVAIKLMPFAASPRLHRPLDIRKTYDVVVVGHARSDRLKIIEKISKHFRVGLFGSGWGTNARIVHGEEHVRAINSAKIYLSFSKTLSGYTNVKVGLFEAIACKVCVVTQRFDEVGACFEFGSDILGYTNENMLLELIEYYSHETDLCDWIAANGYRKLLTAHTWQERWKAVLNDLDVLRYGKSSGSNTELKK
jgi:hypothetical protein